MASSLVRDAGRGAKRRDLPAPYRAVVDSPEAMIAILHFINLKAQGNDSADYPRLFECPCTSHRKIDAANGTVDGVVPLPFSRRHARRRTCRDRMRCDRMR
eukprot:gene5117-4161_t